MTAKYTQTPTATIVEAIPSFECLLRTSVAAVFIFGQCVVLMFDMSRTILTHFCPRPSMIEHYWRMIGAENYIACDNYLLYFWQY